MNNNRWWIRLAGHLTGPTRDHQALEQWIVRCRDQQGLPAQLLVSATEAGVVITPSAPGPLRLPGLTVGRLRGALRAAAIRTELHIAEPTQPSPLRPHAGPQIPPTDLVA